MMKVDFIIGKLSKGGAERVMATLSNYFVEKGHQVRLLTFDKTDDEYELDNKIERVRLTKKRTSNVKFNNLYNLVVFYHKTERRPNVAISFLTFTNLVSIIACKLTKVPIIVSEHNNHTFLLSPKWLVNFTWNYIYRFADYLTVLTDFDVSFFHKKKAKVIVLPNPSSFEPISSNTHNRDKTILAVGSLDRIYHKGFDNLILIMAEILPTHPEWNLKLVGGGTNKNMQFLKTLVIEKKIEAQVEFLGFRNDVDLLMKNASIYILTSRFEGLPMVLLEAMSQGLACIAYNCTTGPSNIITDKVNGVLVADQEMAQMIAKLKELILNKRMRHELGNNGIKSLDKFSVETIYKKWENLLVTLKT